MSSDSITLMLDHLKAGDSRGKLSRSSRSFIEAYQPPRFFVVSRAEHPSVVMSRTEVLFVRFRDLPDLFAAAVQS